MPAVATASSLEEKIRSRTAVVGVIGLGYVGLPLVAGFARAGFPVVGFDIDSAKVSSLAANHSYIAHFPDSILEELHRDRRFVATSEFSRLGEADAILVCVPTPLTPHREPDLSYIESTARQIALAARPGQLVVLESTTYPGTTEEILLPALESAGLVIDRDFYLAFSPEREDPNNPDFTLENIPKVVGGVTPRSGELAAMLYGSVVRKVVPVGSARVAEATKLVENIFRSVNIALVNELKICFDRMGIDVWEVLDAASTKPFGFMRFDPGPGWGGHCLAGSEMVRIRSNSLNSILPLHDLFDRYRTRLPALPIQGAEVILPDDLEALSIDPQSGSTEWRPVSYLFKRRFAGEFAEISFEGNRKLRTTDRHPMLVLKENRLEIREARELREGDRVPQFCGNDSRAPSAVADPAVDLLSDLPEHVVRKLAAARIRPAASRRAMPWVGGNALRVNGVSRLLGSEDVYAIEVPGSHTFATTGGVFVHNCIPVDPFYLTWKAREHGVSTRFIELAGEINTRMPEWVIGKLADALNERSRSLKGSKVLILGVAYKRNVDDIRESPALEIIEMLLSKGADVAYHDPHVPRLHKMRRHDLTLASTPLTGESVSESDAVVIVTDHDGVDYRMITDNARLILDTRSALRKRQIACAPGVLVSA